MNGELRGDTSGRDRRHRLYGPVAERLAAVEGGSHGPLQGREHCALIAEPHLFLRGVDVDVDQLGIDSNIDDGDRVASPLQPTLVALLERVDKRSRADRPSIDGKHDAVAAAATQARLA